MHVSHNLRTGVVDLGLNLFEYLGVTLLFLVLDDWLHHIQVPHLVILKHIMVTIKEVEVLVEI